MISDQAVRLNTYLSPKQSKRADAQLAVIDGWLSVLGVLRFEQIRARRLPDERRVSSQRVFILVTAATHTYIDAHQEQRERTLCLQLSAK